MRLSIRDLDLLTIGMVNDMFAESRNDEYKGYKEIATQEDFDRVSPPISTVIPLILFATADTPSC